MNKLELIFIPIPGAGHLISALEVAICLLDRDDRLSVTVISIKAEGFFSSSDSYIKSLVSSQPRINHVDLPEVELPPPHLLKSIEHYMMTHLENQVPHVRQVLSGRAGSPAAVVLDFFCESFIDVAKEFGIPSYIFLPSNCDFLGLMFELPDYDDRNKREFDISSGTNLSILGFANPVPVSILPNALFDGEHGGYSSYMKIARGFRKVDGVLVNTFAELEPYDYSSAFAYPVYKIGPRLNLKGKVNHELDMAQWDGIWKWLDDQPPSSVVFLCFGSKGTFSKDQAREIAIALDLSGKSFLWSLQLSTEAEAETNSSQPVELEKFLPEGFLERTRGRGFVCGWAPQVEVLAHRAIGGFVSHCGWNSILESLWYGVPIATWPIYAEQQLNAFSMVKEKGLAVELSLDYRKGSSIVEAGEIERAVMRLMDEGGDVREKVKAMKDMARKAGAEGGSTFADIGRFIQDIFELK